MSKLEVQRKFKEQMTKKTRKNGMMEHWNIGLNKTIFLGFSCTIHHFTTSDFSFQVLVILTFL